MISDSVATIHKKEKMRVNRAISVLSGTDFTQDSDDVAPKKDTDQMEPFAMPLRRLKTLNDAITSQSKVSVIATRRKASSSSSNSEAKSPLPISRLPSARAPARKAISFDDEFGKISQHPPKTTNLENLDLSQKHKAVSLSPQNNLVQRKMRASFDPSVSAVSAPERTTIAEVSSAHDILTPAVCTYFVKREQTNTNSSSIQPAPGSIAAALISPVFPKKKDISKRATMSFFPTTSDTTGDCNHSQQIEVLKKSMSKKFDDLNAKLDKIINLNLGS